MVYARAEHGPIDYAPCRYGSSRLVFRGPQQPLDEPYIAVIGGIETYGKFIQRPWPMLVEDAIGVPTVNLACANVSADAYLSDDCALQVAGNAQAVVVQITGAVNLTNPYYAVHPRRNDRFLRALPPLTRLYPEVDFTTIHFTRHLLLTLRKVSRDRLTNVADVLRQTWAERTFLLLERLPAPKVLLWMASHRPGPPILDLYRDPLLVDTLMLDAIRPRADAYAEVILPHPGDPVEEGLAFASLDRPAAEGLPGVKAHQAVADAVVQAIARLG
jgi:Domain of unknown function (DUF6473)